MAGQLIFITGATGFIGAHVVRVALEAGYRVRLSIRKVEQEAALRARYPGNDSKLETVQITDFGNPESFKSALQDVDYVFHIASPMVAPGLVDLQKDYVQPAVKATLGVLNAALSFPKIKKVAVVSSIVALQPVDFLLPTSLENDYFTKENGNVVIPVDPNANYGDDLFGQMKNYSHSKIAAHLATRDFLKEKKPHYDLITIHPGYVMGDSMTQKDAAGIEGVNGMFWMSLGMEKPMIGTVWIHVRDVADAHIKAIQNPVPTGTEIVMHVDQFWWKRAVNYIRKEYPSLDCKIDPGFGGMWDSDAKAARELLGMELRSVEQIIKDTVDQQLALQAQG
ncbi:NAD(P)-binding protein [Polyplosphaeria fusca]|uniref:NAD(P)-binding protein n=1 Tax=Polyplosphaeria fusca TaxID=682080 RepID=A0A9P4QQC9_9PLEO|nr:NAD(P)-binding protein [Polyplosphaeria fusca]